MEKRIPHFSSCISRLTSTAAHAGMCDSAHPWPGDAIPPSGLTAHHTVSGSCIFCQGDPGFILELYIICSWCSTTEQNHQAGNRCWSHCKATCTLPVFLSWKSKAAKERSVTAEQPHAQQLFQETTSTGESPSPVTLIPLQKYLIHSSNSEALSETQK